MEAYIKTGPDGWAEARFPFDATVVARLKVAIPKGARAWNPSERCWRVHMDYLTIAFEILRRRFGDVLLVDAATAPPRRPSPIRRSDPYLAELYLLPNAPRFVIEAVYRALARENHPDKFPVNERAAAHELMVAINRAYEAIRDRIAS